MFDVFDLFISENKILFSPFIAKKLGLNEAVVFAKLIELRQYHSTHRSQDGTRWVRMSIADWHLELPFFSEATINRSMLKLRRALLVQAKNLNQEKTDATLSYAVDDVGFHAFLQSHLERK